MPSKAPNTPTTQKAVHQVARTSAHPPLAQAQSIDSFLQQRTLASPDQARPSDILTLQRKVGNQAVTRLIQAKLTVGPAHDRYEQEADRVAVQVTTMPVLTSRRPSVQRAAEEEEEVQTKPLVASITPLVQREAAPEEEGVQAKLLIQREAAPEEEEVQTKPIAQCFGEGGFQVDDAFERQLASGRGGGRPLPDRIREFMEPRFGADFSEVRVHTGGEAAQLNRSVSAQAFTLGRDIYLGEGKTDLESEQGKQLLAHELTHVVQQTGAQARRRPVATAGAQRLIQRDDILEQEFWSAEKWGKGAYQSAQTDATKSPKESVKEFGQALKPETKNWQWFQNTKQSFANWKAQTAVRTGKFQGLKTFGKRAGSILAGAGAVLGETFLGPIWRIGKGIYNIATGNSKENFQDFKRYGRQLLDVKMRSEIYGGPKWLNWIPPFLSFITQVILKEIISFAGWAALITGLIGLIPYCQPALGVSSTLGLIALAASGLKLAIAAVLDSWGAFRQSYLYRLIKKHADANGGDISGIPGLVAAYQGTRAQYEVTKGQYIGDLVNVGVGMATAGLAGGFGNLAGGKSFGSGFMEGFNPATAVAQGVSGFQGASYSAGGAFAAGSVTSSEVAKNIASGAITGGTAGPGSALGSVSEGMTGETVKKTRKAGEVRTGPLAPALGPRGVKYRSGLPTDISQLLEPPLMTTSGKLRSLTNPITAIYTMVSTAAKILRGVIAGFAWFIGLIKRFLKWSGTKLKGSKLDPRTWSNPFTAIGNKLKGSKLDPRTWSNPFKKGTVQPKRDPALAGQIHAAPVAIQRAGEDEQPETGGPEMDDTMKTKLQEFTSVNQAEGLADTLDSITTVMSEGVTSINEAATEGAG